MRFDKPIKIQKLNLENETWIDYYSTHAEINKASGNEYVNAGTNISSSTYKFKTRFCNEIDALQFDTELFRIIYKDKCLDIKNVDNFKEENHTVTIFAEYNGKAV